MYYIMCVDSELCVGSGGVSHVIETTLSECSMLWGMFCSPALCVWWSLVLKCQSSLFSVSSECGLHVACVLSDILYYYLSSCNCICAVSVFHVQCKFKVTVYVKCQCYNVMWQFSGHFNICINFIASNCNLCWEPCNICRYPVVVLQHCTVFTQCSSF